MGARSWTSAGWTSGLATGASAADTRGPAPSAGIPAIFQNDRMSVVLWMWARTYELFHAIGKLSFNLITIILFS